MDGPFARPGLREGQAWWWGVTGVGSAGYRCRNMRGLILCCPTQARVATRSSAFPFRVYVTCHQGFIRSRMPPSSVGVDLDLGLLHVIDVLLLSHSGHTRGPCTPSPQASRAWRASHHAKIVMYPFSMISPPKIAGKGSPRLSAMGGRAGCNPDSPLRLTTKCRLPAA